MRIVVTGATGLIGQHLVPSLCVDHDVCVIARRERPSEVPASVRWIRADLTAAALPDELPARVDAVIHLAQSSSYRDFPAHALDVFGVNVASTARLLDWSLAAGVTHFVLASSGGIQASRAMSYYAASKRSAELLAHSYASLFRVLVLRFFFVYGIGQKPWMLVPRLIDAVRGGREIPLPGTTGPRLNPVHVRDVVRAMTHAVARQTTGCIDIAGPQVLTVRDMCDAIAMHLGTRPRFDPQPDRQPDDLIGDIEAMSTELSAPDRRFADGIADMVLVGEGRAR